MNERGVYMVTGDSMRGFNDLIILAVLMKEDSYGYQISSTIQSISNGSYVMKETTLYSAFARLEKKELIRSYASTKTFGKPRTYYTLTALGKVILQEKIMEWENTEILINQFVDASGY